RRQRVHLGRRKGPQLVRTAGETNVAIGTVNKVTLVGPLGADPQIRRTTTGRKAAILNIETSDYWQDKAIAKSRTQWHRIVIYNERLAEIAERYLRKGARQTIMRRPCSARRTA